MAYKVGVIGTGAIGVEHARRINQRIGGLTIHHISTSAPGRMEDTSGTLGRVP